MDRIDQQLFEIGKIQPHAIDLEEAVLGAIMLEKDAAATTMQLLTIDVFYLDKHKQIFKAINNLFDKKETADILTVTNELKRLKQLDAIGGAYYVTQLTNRIASAANIDTHCRILLQHFFKREQIRISTEVLKQAYDPYVDVFDTKENAISAFKNIGSFIQSNAAVNNNQTIDEVVLDLGKARGNSGILGSSTGIKNLDLAISGLIPTCTYVIAGESGMGKTSLVKGICINLSHVQGKAGIFFSMDASKQTLMRVCISEILQISNEVIKSGNVSAADIARIMDLKKSTFLENFLVVDKPGLSPDNMRNIITKENESRTARGLSPISWIAIDYLRLMRLKGKQHAGKNLDAVLSEITTDLKNIAKEFNIVVLELAQLNKENKKRSNPRPILSDIRDSNSIEANADVVLFPYRPEKVGVSIGDSEEDTGHTELIIAKNREGPLKVVPAIYRHQFTQFVNDDEGKELNVKYNPSADSDGPPNF